MATTGNLKDSPAFTTVPHRGLARRAAVPRYGVAYLVHSPMFLTGAGILLFWCVMAIFWRLIVPYNPYAVDPLHTFAGPSAQHWLGTDQVGRDVWSRVLAGATTVLTIAPLATLMAIILGAALGLVSGYYRGVLDDILMRGVDAFLAFPALIIAVVALGLLGPSQWNLIIVIAIFFAPLIGRTVRSAVISVREHGYVEAAKLRGEGGPFTMIVEILPNVTGPIVVEATIRLGYAVFTAATLSFLGLGLQPPSADWGLTIATTRGYIEFAPWVVLAPAIALASLVVAVNLIADGSRKAFQG